MAGDVKLKLGLDTTDADRAFVALIRKIQSEADKVKLSPATAAAARGGAVQTARDSERNLSREKSLLDTYNRSLESRKKILEDIIKLETKGVAQQGERERAEARLNHARHVASIQKASYQREEERARKSMGLTDPQGGGVSTSSILKGTLGAMGVQASIKSAYEAVKAVYSFSVSEAAKINLSAGSAVQNNVGYLNQSMLSGDIAQQNLLQGQMGKARETATRAWDLDPQNVLDRVISKIAVGVGATSWGEYFETERARQIGGNALKQAQSSLDQNNPLMLAQGFFDQTFSRNLGTERASGLSSDQFKKLQIQLNNKGFLTNQGTDLLSQIQGAGGAASGDQAGGIAALGLQMQRAFNITNASGMLGKLTGLYGGSGQGAGNTNDAAARILEAAITRGLNKSENTEILRKFTDTSSALIYQASAQTPQDVERIARDFLGMLPANATPKQYEGAQGAFEKYQSLTSQTAGRGGTLGFAAMMQNGNFSKLSPIQMGNLMALPEARITSTNSDVISAAAQQGISPGDLVSEILKVKNSQSLGTVGLSQKQLAPLRKYLGNRDPLSLLENGGAELNRMKKSNPAAFQAFQELQARAGIEGEFVSDEEKQAATRRLYMGPAGYQKPGNTARARGMLETGAGGKKEEEYVAAQAAQEKQMVLNLKALEDQLYPTVKGISDLTKVIMALGTAAHILTTGELGAALSKYTTTGQTKESFSRTPGNASKPSGRQGLGGY